MGQQEWGGRGEPRMKEREEGAEYQKSSMRRWIWLLFRNIRESHWCDKSKLSHF